MAVPLGKYTKITPDNPLAVGKCDYSGLIFRRADMSRQMEYSSRGLYWTGFFVSYKYLDKPNPQRMAPIVTPDPIPIQFPRPDPDLPPITNYSNGFTTYTGGFNAPFIVVGP